MTHIVPLPACHGIVMSQKVHNLGTSLELILSHQYNNTYICHTCPPFLQLVHVVAPITKMFFAVVLIIVIVIIISVILILIIISVILVIIVVKEEDPVLVVCTFQMY